MLVRETPPVKDSFLKPFALKTETLLNDFRCGGSGGVPADLEQAILKLEREGVMSS